MRGYHATSAAAAAEIVAEQRVIESRNAYDWLGWGAYFWEDGINRAWAWAADKYGEDGAVVSVPIRLGKCLNLADAGNARLLTAAYDALTEEYARAGRDLPANEGEGRRPLDCLVVNFVCQNLLEGVETVRAAMDEGPPLYPGASFKEKAHLHLCVRAGSAYVGKFVLEARP